MNLVSHFGPRGVHFLSLATDSRFLLIQTLADSSDGSSPWVPCHPCEGPGWSSWLPASSDPVLTVVRVEGMSQWVGAFSPFFFFS